MFRPNNDVTLTFSPAAVARPHHYSDTSVTYSQTPSVNVLPAPLHTQTYPVVNPSPYWTTLSHPAPPPDSYHSRAILYPSPAQPPGLEMLAASSYGVPKPAIPYFDTGQESDFALLKWP